MEQGGGGYKALGRHAVAALLNSSNPDVDPAFDAAAVIALVQDAYASGEFEAAKDLLAAANEQGCPIGKQTERNGGKPDRQNGQRKS